MRSAKSLLMPIRIRSRRPQQVSVATRPASSSEIALPAVPNDIDQREPGLSLCMIVKNEERFLERCLRSAFDVVDEICIADTGSTDGTVAIAESFGARVRIIEWRNDFSWARNKSLEMATKRWILVLDADEELLPESKPALNALKTMNAYQTAVWLRCFNRSDDYKGTGAMSHALIRIFPNRPEIRYRGLIHEYPSIGDRDTGLDAVLSPVAIDHHGYMKEIVEGRNKGQRNLEIVKAATEKEPQDPFHWFNLGSTAFLLGDAETARMALEKMVDIAGDRPRGFIPNGLALLSEIYCDKVKDPKRAQEVAEHALRLSPHYANAHFQLGKALIGQRRFAEGRAAFQSAIDDAAYAEKQFVVDDEVYVWKAHSEIGSSYVMEGDDTNALAWFEHGLRNRPNAQPLRINKARALERLGRHEDARIALSQLHAIYPDEPTTVEYVNFLLRRGLETEALAVIDASIDRLNGPASLPLLLAASAVAQKLGLSTDEKYLRLAAGRAPGSAAILGSLEALLTARGKTDDMTPFLASERDSVPVALDDFLRRSHLALVAGTYRDAADMALAGLERFPEARQLRYNAGAALARLAQREDAFAVLRPLHDHHDEAAFRAAQLELQMYLDVDDYAAATNVVDSGLLRFAQDASLTIFIAKYLVAHGHSEEAVAHLYRAFDRDRQRVGVELGTLLISLGRIDEAGKVADKALS